ncbi:MAG: acyltransferase family protein [Pseudomonadota bacterium]
MNSVPVPLREAWLHWLRHDAAPLTEPRLGRALGLSRLLLVIGLVFLHYRFFPGSAHTPWDGFDPDQYQVATFVSSFLLFFFFSSVPLLSMVSGWLFFAFEPTDAQGALQKRIVRRVGTVYLPMVAWNALYLVLLLALFAWRPGAPLLGTLNVDFARAGAWDYVNALFGLTAHPIGFQFWFVRDLFVTALVSPLLWLALRHAPWLGLGVLGVAWLVGSNLGVFFRADVVLFFYIGGLLRTRGARLEIGPRATLVLLAVYVALVALRTLAPLFLEWEGSQRPLAVVLLTRLLRLAGALACWGLFVQLAATDIGARLARYAGLAFFVHAAHFPLIEAVKFALWPYLPAHGDAWLIAHYLASVLATVAITVGAGIALARAWPSAFALMNGGREAIGPKDGAGTRPALGRPELPPAL